MKYFIIFFLLHLMIVSVAAASDKITIYRTENKPYPAVLFDHGRHNFQDKKWNCNTCHHKGPVETSCSSSSCHKGRNGTRLYHTMCIGCHKTYNETAPMSCSGCHKIK